jgi:anti-sigma regulatory factor (Ser/Thr protein kinase)
MDTLAVPVPDAGAVAAARRAAARLAGDLGFSEAEVGRIALLVTEAATNLVKHAGGGELLVGVGVGEGDDAPSVEILALDRGHGMVDVAACLRDGYSTAGSPGTGLGAIRRLATTFDVYSAPGLGTAVLAVVGPRPPSRARATVAVGGLAVAKPGEDVCGDAWATVATPAGCRVLVVDGLGHGPDAAAAARIAVRLFRESRGATIEDGMQRMHDGLRATRGASLGIAELDAERRLVSFVGVGNVAAMVASAAGTRHLVSHNGTAGHQLRRIQVFTAPWPAGALVLLHSDGLASHWTLDRYPGLSARYPTLVAGVLYRDHRRGRDDTTVVVAREAA